MQITNDKQYTEALERAERLADALGDDGLTDRLVEDLAALDEAIAEYERKHLDND